MTIHYLFEQNKGFWLLNKQKKRRFFSAFSAKIIGNEAKDCKILQRSFHIQILSLLKFELREKNKRRGNPRNNNPRDSKNDREKALPPIKNDSSSLRLLSLSLFEI